MAEQYFKHYPTIDFDLKNDGNLIEAKDIFRNIRVSEDVEEGITGYEYYYVDDQDRPDVLADKLYADSTLYWLFWMVNPHLATYTDWPKSQRVLERFIKRKYSGKALVSNQQSDIVGSSDSKFFQGEKVVGSTSSAFGFVTKIDPTNKQIILNDIEGTFINNEVVTGSNSSKSFTIISVRNFSDSPHHYEDSEGTKTTISTGNTPVSNFDYEQKFNDDKRSIKYIKLEFIPELLRQFKSMIRE
jgi:hypothetical protein|tara:strand:+ start:1703 stop:2431 length:729 start_codon:yes stop_codon:yes gene_type:complete